MPTLAKTLKKLRGDRTQEEMATKAKITHNCYWKIEAGKTLSPDLDTLRKLAKAFNVKLSELIGE